MSGFKPAINPSDLGINLTEVIGLTDWQRGTPPAVGWWNVRVSDSHHVNQRRWWNGEVFSWAVIIGEHDEVDAKELCRRISKVDPAKMEWQGLKAPAESALIGRV